MFDLVFCIALAPRSQTRIGHHRMTQYNTDYTYINITTKNGLKGQLFNVYIKKL